VLQPSGTYPFFLGSQIFDYCVCVWGMSIFLFFLFLDKTRLHVQSFLPRRWIPSHCSDFCGAISHPGGPAPSCILGCSGKSCPGLPTLLLPCNPLNPDFDLVIPRRNFRRFIVSYGFLFFWRDYSLQQEHFVSLQGINKPFVLVLVAFSPKIYNTCSIQHTHTLQNVFHIYLQKGTLWRPHFLLCLKKVTKTSLVTISSNAHWFSFFCNIFNCLAWVMKINQKNVIYVSFYRFLC
jgi:hypothetical protein